MLHSAPNLVESKFILIVLSILSAFDMNGLRKWVGFESRLCPTPRISVQCHMPDAHNIHVMFVVKRMTHHIMWQDVLVY